MLGLVIYLLGSAVAAIVFIWYLNMVGDSVDSADVLLWCTCTASSWVGVGMVVIAICVEKDVGVELLSKLSKLDK